MDAPPSPNYVFNFPEVEFKEDPQKDPEEESEEDPEEDPEKELESEAEDDVPHPATPPVGSPITPPPLFESSSDTEDVAPVIENEALEMPPIGSTYEGKKRDKMEQDLGDEMQFSNVVEHRVTDLENREQEKAEEMDKMKKHLGMLEANYSLVLSDRDVIMDAPPSPNYVFNFPEVEFEEDPQKDPEEESEEDPEEDPEKELESEAEDDVPHPATPPVGSPITPPPLFESSSDTEDVARVIENEALEMPPIGSTYEQCSILERCEKKRKVDMEASSSEICEGKKRMDKMEQDLGDEMQFSNVVEHRVTDLENREQEKAEEMDKKKKHLGMLEANYSLVLSDRDEWRKAFLNLKAWVSERLRRGALDARPDVGDDGPVSFGESKPPKPPRSPSSSQ
nr:hypothetical protein [Tanacetum cinerariifolium]